MKERGSSSSPPRSPNDDSIEELRQALVVAEAEKKALKDDFASVVAQFKQQQRQPEPSAEHTSQIAALEQEVARLKQNHHEAEMMRQQDAQQATQASMDHKDRIGMLEGNNSAIQGENVGLQRDNMRLQGEYTKLDAENERLKAQMSTLKSENGTLQAQKAEALQRNEQLIQQLNDAQEKRQKEEKERKGQHVMQELAALQDNNKQL